MTKYIFVTGGVISSLGKGILTASTGRILKDRGLKISVLKIDPYLNIDPGTLSPYQHGEVFVTDDGSETDLDIGHYERFVGVRLSRINNFTTGQVYHSVIEKERNGDYQGKTVQVVPHIINEIIDRIKQAAREKQSDILITELGGTIGDIESQPFTEAIREMKLQLRREKFLLIHLVLIPFIRTAGEIKTKPAQHSVKELNELGLQPDILICRSEKPLTEEIKSKLSLFCNLDKEDIINAIDEENLYKIPLNLKKEGLDRSIISKLKLETVKDDDKWEAMVHRMEKTSRDVNIGLVGKYVELHDAYKSVIEALQHGGIANDVRVKIEWIQSDEILKKGLDALKGVSGILVPGGFGERGIEGKIEAIRLARENNIPFLGLCLGMQCAVIEFARNKAGLKNANSTEFDKNTGHPVIDIMEDKRNIRQIGGTLRKGACQCRIAKQSRAFVIYKREEISERHRHRYEFNNKYKEQLMKHGLVLSGINEERNLVEMIELADHKFFIGVQFHPEFQSAPDSPHPLFSGFIRASLED
ncbi:MAG: CTP synthase [bacterium]|nr:CTP synthase [bacterium]